MKYCRKHCKSQIFEMVKQGKIRCMGYNPTCQKTAQDSFPQMSPKREFDVLGSVIYTSQRAVYDFPPEKGQKILTDIRNIAALPLPRQGKTKLLGVKILPQCAFSAGISNIPKLTIHKIQAEIVNLLWRNRTSWRSKWLVLTCLGQPHRLDPTIARAYISIMDFLRFYHTHSHCKEVCIRLLNAENSPKFGLMMKLREACELFSMQLNADLTLTWRNSNAMPLEDLTPTAHCAQHVLLQCILCEEKRPCEAHSSP